MELRGRVRPFTWPLLVWVAAGSLSTCHCDCCLAGVTDDGSQEVAACHVNIPGFLATGAELAAQSCGPETCEVADGDSSAGIGSEVEVDYSRFCLYACEPVEVHRGALCKHASKAGRTQGKPLLRGHAPHLATQAQNEAPMPQTLVHVRSYTARAAYAGPQAMPAKDWPSIQGDPHDVGARVEDITKAVSERTGIAKGASELAEQVKVKSAAQVPSSQEAKEMSKGSAEVAALASSAADAFAKEVDQAAKESAHDVMEDTLEALEKEAHKTAKVDAKKVADELEKSMKAKIPKAKEDAAKPYTDTMNRAAAVAGDYVKAGDGLSGQSLTDMLNANMMLGTANQFNAMGSTAKAQGLMRDANNLMGLASSNAGASQKMYDTAAGIMKTIGGYVNQAQAASYNAEVMLNPDAYPPAPPIV